MQTGQFAEGISDLEKARADPNGNSLMVVGPLGNAYARAGRTVQAASVLAELEAAQKSDGMAGVALAMVHTARGEKKQAIELLRQAADAHVTDAMFIAADPAFDPLRSEPDFQICAKLGLPATVASAQ
jgi:Flp pilus assembly protein TadD